mmetsp:Transcript_693/g.1443  ORF Transcript_693/g.1443 Transcript_693/m.1443 type:complete len:218 (-) Transcript_693:408-1061(-)|eukprot:CAMPEP_0172407118 /NCGR_PEP_ID=MMETSP1061-20121228/73278_1 /TAXON_ID=37318 /ORGANISM="Pseudo-nitzschia pungens, Strain cf. pungens" /LENGTH=217 /DNA_ID=CAMNT_0013143011 /DNA_START=144 /DNA_END=797 /DNA_ORIENTATION=-
MIPTTVSDESSTIAIATAAAAAVSSSNTDDGMNDLVKINVGGKIFLQVLRSTLCQAPDDSLFARIFSKNPNRTSYHNYNGHHAPVMIHYDEEGRIFLDHDPELMEIIINFLRIKQIEDPFDPIVESPEIPPHKRKDFRRLLNHFGLTGFFFYPTNIISTTRSIRSMSIDEEPHHVVLDAISITKDSISDQSDADGEGNEDTTDAEVPCPLGYDYCYG